MKTPEEISPYSLLQEELRRDQPECWPWRMLVICMMLNRTTAKQVRAIMDEFFRRWPYPMKFLDAADQEIQEVIRPLGLQARRAQNLLRMTRDYIQFIFQFGLIPLEEIHGIGKYAADSWHIFIAPAEIKEDVEDKELRRYVEWAKSRG